MNIKRLCATAEGLLFIAGDQGLSLQQLSRALGVPQAVVREVIDDLKKDYEKETRGIDLIETAGTYRLATKHFVAPYIQKATASTESKTLSQAALETLAIIAYKQPITKAEIEEIRGVRTDRSLATLSEYGLVEEKGRSEGAGRPILYGTTDVFLDHFGLRTIADLPPLAEVDRESLAQESLFYKNDSSPD